MTLEEMLSDLLGIDLIDQKKVEQEFAKLVLAAMTTHIAIALLREEDRILNDLVSPELRYKSEWLIAERSLSLACKILELIDKGIARHNAKQQTTQ